MQWSNAGGYRITRVRLGRWPRRHTYWRLRRGDEVLGEYRTRDVLLQHIDVTTFDLDFDTPLHPDDWPVLDPDGRSRRIYFGGPTAKLRTWTYNGLQWLPQWWRERRKQEADDDLFA